MEKVKDILSIIGRVLSIITMACIIMVSMATAYIVFAPDQWPKPFYLSYIYPTPTPTPDANAPTATPAPTPTPDIKPGEGVMINTGTKIINLADPTGRKYIRTTIVFEFAPTNPNYASLTEEEKTAYLTSFNAEITAKMPVMDDAVITLLSTKTFDDLYTADGKEAIRQEILKTVQARLPEYHILSVYFTEFVVQ